MKIEFTKKHNHRNKQELSIIKTRKSIKEREIKKKRWSVSSCEEEDDDELKKNVTTKEQEEIQWQIPDVMIILFHRTPVEGLLLVVFFFL